jgi:ankyrin repeat protein
MFYKTSLIAIGILYCNLFFTQSLSSAPHKVKDLYHSNQSLWVIGESDQNGNGVYKYQNNNWYYFGVNDATKITSSSVNNPAIINDKDELSIFINNQWSKIASNVKCFSGSYQSNHLWAVINNELKLYQNSSWTTPIAANMVIEEITEAGDGSLYTLHSSNYLFKLNGTIWEIVNSQKGKNISASKNSILYLSKEIINASTNNVKKYQSGNWSDLAITAQKIVGNSQQVVYYIDGFNRLFEVNGQTKRQISSNPIINNTNNNNKNYGTNPHAIDSLTGETSLFKAIRNNDITGMFTILSQGANINKINNNQETPLIVASKIGETKLITSLIGLKPNLEHIDKDSKNALWYMVEKRDTDIVALLIQKGAKPNSLDYLTSVVNYKYSDEKKLKLIDIFLKANVKVTAAQINKIITLNHEKNYFQLINAPNKVILTKANYNQFTKDAIEVKNKTIAKNCVEKGADANPLASFAITVKDKSLIQFCLSKGANPKPVIEYAIIYNDNDLLTKCLDNFGGSIDDALMFSCKYSKIKYATELLNKGADPNGPMKSMIIKNDTSFVSLLLNNGADGTNSENFKNGVKTKSLEMVKLLLKNGAIHNDGIITSIEVQSLAIVQLLLPNSNKENIKLIETASSRKNLEIIKLLLNNGSNPQNGLDIAINSNNINAVNLLIENGARIDSDDLLINAVKTKNLDLVKVLVHNAISHIDTVINYGIDISAGIKYAVNQNSADIVKYLFENGADKTNSDEYLTVAVINNHLATLRVLIQNGLNMNVTNNEKNTLIHLSCIKNNFSITKELILSNKIDINTYNDDGMTALMYVVKIKRKDFSLAKLLVENGADVNARDDYGIIIRKMAKGRKLKKYLKKNGAFRK